jgi:hypothetical protein
MGFTPIDRFVRGLMKPGSQPGAKLKAAIVPEGLASRRPVDPSLAPRLSLADDVRMAPSTVQQARTHVTAAADDPTALSDAVRAAREARPGAVPESLPAAGVPTLEEARERVQRVREHAERTLGRPAPMDTTPALVEERALHGRDWLHHVQDEARQTRLTARSLEDLSAGRVFRAVDDRGETFIFRRLPSVDAPDLVEPFSVSVSEVRNGRLTHAATRMNAELGLETVPRGRPAMLKTPDGQEWTGIRSDLVPAAADPRLHSDPHGLIAAMDRAEAADVAAFEYLVGNLDVHDGLNMALLDGGKARVFDHGLAFFPTLLDASEKRVLGTQLPTTGYTAPFLEKLRDLTPERLDARFADVLSPGEREAIAFRRLMLLEDAKSAPVIRP